METTTVSDIKCNHGKQSIMFINSMIELKKLYNVNKNIINEQKHHGWTDNSFVFNFLYILCFSIQNDLMCSYKYRIS